MIVRSSIITLLPSVLLLTTPQSWAAETRGSESWPRGVGPEFAKFYKGSSSDTFTCISNPSVTIPFSSVNDDYCDCPDGSDEPGTSACSYLSPLSPPQYHPGYNPNSASVNSTFVLPGFYCKNKGHIPNYVRFESVNDGICDYDLCCDGSDEWANVGGKKCEDRCKELGKEYRKQEEVRNKVLNASLKRRKDLLAQADRATKDAQDKVDALKIKIRGYEIKVSDAQQNLQDVERKEKLKVVQSGEAGSGTGKLGVLLGLSKSRVEELRESLQKTRTQRDAMLSRVAELENLLAALKTDYNPNFNDEGVRRAVRGWEDYAARDTDDSWTEAEDRDLNAVLSEDGAESGINWAEFDSSDEESKPESDVEALLTLTAYLPHSLQTWLSAQVASLRTLLVENGILADNSSPSSSTSSTESKAVQHARDTVSANERDLQSARNELLSAEQDLDADYGPDGIFRALKDVCLTKDTGEYTYEMCFMKSTKQKPNRGGVETGMGAFTGFDTEYVDEPPVDAENADKGIKSLGTGDRLVMKFENGQHCWNGPNRSVRVIMGCDTTEAIWKVSETEKCVYRIEVGTAAVCRSSNRKGKKEDGKDEL